MNRFRLRFDPSRIDKLASQFDDIGEPEIVDRIVPTVKQTGFINKEDFLLICEWKSPRSKTLCKKNAEELVKEITKISINTKNEKLKIEILLLLKGVSWPTASTILHFISDFNYPIIDFRALWSLNCAIPSRFTFEFWNVYSLYCRKIAKNNNVSLRVLDKALWQYSSENQ